MIRVLSLLFLTGWLLSAQANAAVESVTVFPDRATVSHRVEFEIDAGTGEVTVSDLPVSLSRDSLRLSASGPDGLRLGSFRLETVRGSERVSPRAQQLESRLQALRDETATIDDALEARALQLELLRSLVSGAGEGESRLSAEGWTDALETIGSGAGAVLSERRALQLQRRDLAESIQRLEQELADLGQRQRDTLSLHLAYESPTAGAATISVDYTVGGAYWRPVYEWRLDTENDRLDVVQFAEVRQRTGEDWSDAVLNLSLARPASGGRLPELSTWWVDVFTPQPQRMAESKADRAAQGLAAEAEMAMSPAVDAAEWRTAERFGSEYTQAYRVAGRVNVAADNQPYRFRLDEQALDVVLSARSVPRYQPAAWLYAEGRWEGDVALPPGSVTLYQDATLVGETRFEGAAPGETLASSFGVDDRITVEVELVRDDRATEGMLSKSTVLTRVHRFRVSNGHARPIDVTVMDAMPVSRDERIEVAMTEGSTAPDRRNVDDRRGVLAWDATIAEGAERALTVGYRLRYPADLPGVQGW